MTDPTAADADESLGAVVQRCELQIAALAGRLDAESLRRSSATREISSTVESQLLAVRSTIHGLAAVRAAVEKIGREVAETGQHGAASESQAAALDVRVAGVTRHVESQLGVLEDKLSRMQGTVDAIRAEIAAGPVLPAPAAEGTTSGAPPERWLQERAAIHGECAALRVAVAEVRAELAQLGETLTRTGSDAAAVHRDVEQALEGMRAEMGEALGGVRAEMGQTLGGVRAEMDEAPGAVRAALEERLGGVRADIDEALGGVRREVGETRVAVADAQGSIEAVRADVSAVCTRLDTAGQVVATLRGEVETAIELLRTDLASTRARVDDTARALDGTHGTISAIGEDVGGLQDACDATAREAAAVRDAIAAFRDATDERLAGMIGVRDETHGLRAQVDGLRGELAGLRGNMDGAVEGLKQSVAGTGAGLVDASGTIAAVRDELEVVRGAMERSYEETRVLRADLEAVRRDVVQAAHAGAPEDLRALVAAVERLRSGLARQDALVDERIMTGHRATEALRAELTDMRGEMQQMVALVRAHAARADAWRAGIAEPLAAALETLRAPFATAQAVVERVPAVLGTMPTRILAILEEIPAALDLPTLLQRAATLPAPIVTLATALLRRVRPPAA